MDGFWNAGDEYVTRSRSTFKVDEATRAEMVARALAEEIDIRSAKGFVKVLDGRASTGIRTGLEPQGALETYVVADRVQVPLGQTQFRKKKSPATDIPPAAPPKPSQKAVKKKPRLPNIDTVRRDFRSSLGQDWRKRNERFDELYSGARAAETSYFELFFRMNGKLASSSRAACGDLRSLYLIALMFSEYHYFKDYVFHLRSRWKSEIVLEKGQVDLDPESIALFQHYARPTSAL